MANTANYETNIARLKDTYKRYTVSRIIANPLDNLLELEIPALIPEKFFVEISLYSLANNNVVFNTTIDNQADPSIFTVTTLQYSDGGSRRLIFIDFSKLPTVIEVPDGRFEVVLNFFVPEIGNQNTYPLILNTVSPSRTEIEVKLAPQYKTPQSASLLTTFASPQINAQWALDALKYICNQSQSLNPNIPTEKTALTFDIVEQFLPTTTVTAINNPSALPIFTASIKDTTQAILNGTYRYASSSLATQLHQSTRITDTLFYTIVSSSLSRAVKDQEETGPEFTLDRTETSGTTGVAVTSAAAATNGTAGTSGTVGTSGTTGLSGRTRRGSE